MKLDPKDLELQAKSGIETKFDQQGRPLAYKGPHLPDWYDNYNEMLKENQWAKRKQDYAREGKNEHGQTPEQEKEFKKRQAVQLERKKKAELAAEIAVQNK